MALIDSLKSFAQKVGRDMGALTNKIGDTSALTTTDKTSVVSAVNEIKSNLNSLNVGVDEAAVGTIATAKAKEEINKIVAGAPAALDTLKELADAVQDGSTTAQAVAAKLNTKLSFSEAQVLTAQQQQQACTNLGLGDTSINLLAIYVTAKGA